MSFGISVVEIGIFGQFGKYLFPVGLHAEEQNESDTAESLDPECSIDNLQPVYEEVRKGLESSPDIYNINFSIETLAAETGISSRRISQAVNACSGKNFSRLLAEYRVNEACRILREVSNPVMRPTMDALAQQVGYKSRTHLTRVFKTEIGMTPAEYIATLAGQN